MIGQRERNGDILTDRPGRVGLSTINTFVQQQARPRASAKDVPFGKKSKTFYGRITNAKVTHRNQ
jgi:hypothetical protein